MDRQRKASGIGDVERVERSSSGAAECTAGLPPVECRGAGPAGERLRGRGGWPGNWPVKVQLVPPNATYLEGARLVIVADCVPLVYPGFREEGEPGRVLLTACPKLGDAWFVRAKLAQILSPNKIEGVEVLHVDVPCCGGLVRIVREAMKDARCGAPARFRKVGLDGDPARALVSGGKAGKAATPLVERTPAGEGAETAAVSK